MIRRALRLGPHNPDGQASLARSYVSRGEWEKGIAVLGTFVEQHPNCPRGRYHYARWLFRTGECRAAAEAILGAYAPHQSDTDIYRAAYEILPYVAKLNDFEQGALLPDQPAVLLGRQRLGTPASDAPSRSGGSRGVKNE